MELVHIIKNILNRLYLPGEVLVTSIGLIFEIVTPDIFILSNGKESQKYDISQVEISRVLQLLS